MDAMTERILITGSSGLIGYALSKRLANQFTVIGFDRQDTPQPLANVDWVTVDLTSDERMCGLPARSEGTRGDVCKCQSRWKDRRAVVMGDRGIGTSSDCHSDARAARADLSRSLHLIQNTGCCRWGSASHPAGPRRLEITAASTPSGRH